MAATESQRGYRPDDKGNYAFAPATVSPPIVKAVTVTATAAQQPPVPVTACVSYNDFSYTDHTAAAVAQGPLFTPFTPTADNDPALYLGVDQPFSQRPVTLFLQVEPPLPEQVAAESLAEAVPAAAAQLAWEYATTDGWRPLAALDETQSLSSRGLVTFVGPAGLRCACVLRADLVLAAAAVARRHLPAAAPATTGAAQHHLGVAGHDRGERNPRLQQR